jgi:hypothetical protein
MFGVHARLPACRRHAPHLLATATGIKHCCQSLAAVLRDNAPVGYALIQLEQLEETFLALQQAVGSAATTAASLAAEQAATGADAQQQEAAKSQTGAGSSADAAGDCAAGAAGLGGADVAQDSLALHLALSMLFTCCTMVRQQQRRGHGWLARYPVPPVHLASSRRGSALCSRLRWHRSAVPAALCAFACLLACLLASLRLPAGAQHVLPAPAAGGARPAKRGQVSGRSLCHRPGMGQRPAGQGELPCCLVAVLPCRFAALLPCRYGGREMMCWSCWVQLAQAGWNRQES